MKGQAYLPKKIIFVCRDNQSENVQHDKMIKSILLAVRQCRIYVITVFFTYCISCLVGIIMVHTGNNFALSYRDKIVGRALETDNASINYKKGNNFLAALNDFKGNLLFGAVPQTIMGIGIIVPYFTVFKTRLGWRNSIR